MSKCGNTCCLPRALEAVRTLREAEPETGGYEFYEIDGFNFALRPADANREVYYPHDPT